MGKYIYMYVCMYSPRIRCCQELVSLTVKKTLRIKKSFTAASSMCKLACMYVFVFDVS